MDALKLKNSCICGNTEPYAACCGRYQALPEGPQDERTAFRHDLHELMMYLFPLRNIYQAYWEKLSEEPYPHHLLMPDADYGRAVVANFFWDYSVQFSDARPVLRAARDVEERNLRLANDFRQWSLSPCWLWEVISADPTQAHVRMADSDRVRRVEHGGEVPEPGRWFAGRLLAYRGHEHVHPAVLTFPEGSEALLPDRLRRIGRGLGVRSGNGLRPDVQCEEWRRHGAQVLALWRELTYDARVGVPSRAVSLPHAFTVPLPRGDAARLLEAAGAVQAGRGRHELRDRALTLARFETGSRGLQVTLLDEAYRDYVERWLAERLRVGAPADGGAAPATPAPEAGDWDVWARSAQPALGGETPLEASRHDFGRRRLRALLDGLALREAERGALHRQLGR